MKTNDPYEYDKENRLWTFMTPKEEREYYKKTLQNIIDNPRWYLDHFDELIPFRVSFIHYYNEDTQLKRAKKKRFIK